MTNKICTLFFGFALVHCGGTPDVFVINHQAVDRARDIGKQLDSLDGQDIANLSYPDNTFVGCPDSQACGILAGETAVAVVEDLQDGNIVSAARNTARHLYYTQSQRYFDAVDDSATFIQGTQ